MFLDPEPRTSRKRPQSQTDFSSFTPPSTAAPADQRIIRKPLLEKSSNSKIKQEAVKDEHETPLKPTVRLVRQSPSVASIRKEVFGETDKQKGWSKRHSRGQEYLEDDKKKLPETGSDVSDASDLANESPRVDASLDDSLQESDVDVNELPSWKRRSVSSSNLSDATTLKGSSVARFSYNHSTHSRSTRISSGTTLQDNFDSSVLHETDLDDLPESASEAGPLPQDSPSLTDLSISETPVHSSTIRTVHSSEGSHDDDASHHTVTPRPVSSRRSSWPSPSTSDLMINSSPPTETSQFAPSIPPRISSKHVSSPSTGSGIVRRSSTDLLQSSPISVGEYATSIVHHSPERNDRVSIDIDTSEPSSSTANSPSEHRNALGITSSPNFLAYSSSPVRPRSRSHPLRGETSFESIASRLHGGPISDARHGLALRNSWASFDPSSSQETIPSIQIPRRRLRQVRGSLSLDATRRSQMAEQDTSRDISANLSTIMSESERSRSRSFGQQLSQLDGANASAKDSTIIASDDYTQLSSLSPVPSFESYATGSSDDDEPGDMTLNLYREASAKPAPLFRPQARSTNAQLLDKRYHGPLPPLPPMPANDAEEHLDRVAELTSPDLRPKRSGYSLRRQRSSSTPLHARHLSAVSKDDSDRWSISSNIFPTWARHFYSGNIALASMSMISLHSVPATPTRDGAQNGMRLDQRPGMRYQNSLNAPTTPSTNITKSPRSSHFIPAIFRPRTRPLRKSIGAVRDLIRPSEHRRASNKHAETAERDSMAIEPAPPTGISEEGHLPSGHPKFGELQAEGATPPRPHPRAYSKQKQWNDMSFPRPMSKDHVTTMDLNPHLATSKHSSQQLDTWRPPSFVESIDLIFKSQGHRQILFFLLGFLCPLVWMVGALMPLPERPVDAFDPAKITPQWLKENTDVSMDPQEAEEAAVRWRAEKAWRQGVWWRNVNRVMSVVGLLIIGAVVSLPETVLLFFAC